MIMQNPYCFEDVQEEVEDEKFGDTERDQKVGFLLSSAPITMTIHGSLPMDGFITGRSSLGQFVF